MNISNIVSSAKFYHQYALVLWKRADRSIKHDAVIMLATSFVEIFAAVQANPFAIWRTD
jgi:hypothetical protein